MNDIFAFDITNMKITKTFPLFIVLFMLSNNIHGQDTTFIFRNMEKEFYHAIYIESNKDYKYFKNIKQFSLHGSDSIGMLLSVEEELKQYKQKISHSKIDSIFPRVWYQLNAYKNHLYLYEPNDNGFNTNKVLSDSCLINFNMDGPYPILIDSVKQIGKTALHLFTKTYYKPDVDTISIYILDWERKIALFDYHNPYLLNRYRLMVAAETSNTFSVIVNYSKYRKCFEYQFSPIDFEPYLNQLGLKK